MDKIPDNLADIVESVADTLKPLSNQDLTSVLDALGDYLFPFPEESE